MVNKINKNLTAEQKLVLFEDGTETSFDLLQKVLDINSAYRVQYDLDEREKVNNITFVDFGGNNNVDNGQTEEELEDKGDGDTLH